MRVLLLFVLICAGCKREDRAFRAQPPFDDTNVSVQLTGLVAASGTNQIVNAAPDFFLKDFQGNAYQMSEGQKLYENFNCVTCHAHGGGDIGPPLADSHWIYGYEPQQIFDSIVQ